MKFWSGVIVAGLYLLLGAAGLMLAIPPGYASPVFPAAGLALAAALHHGWRVLPFIFLGSFSLNFGNAWLFGELTLNSGLGAIGIGLGASLQAALAASLVKAKLGDRWQRLENERQIVKLLIWGALVACLVSATVAVPFLYALGLLDQGSVFFVWWTWYSGDLLGAAIFTPMALLFFASGNDFVRERRGRIVAPVCVALVLSLTVYAGVAFVEQQQIQERLEDDGAEIARRIQDRLITHQAVLASVKHFVDAHPDFTYLQFERFTKAALAANPDIFAISFNDVVPRDRLAAYEAGYSLHSPLGPFKVTERDASKQLVPVADRPEYVVVRYIVPIQGNAPALGFDINSEPVRQDAIARARKTGESAVTGPIRLVQETTVRMGVLMLDPIAMAGKDDSSVSTGSPVEGFAVAVIKVGQLIDIATRGHVPAGLHFQVNDGAVADPSLQFYKYDTGSRAEEATYRRRIPLRIADRHWMLDVWATDGYINQRRHWLSWAVGVVAMLFTVLLQLYLHGMTGRVVAFKRQNEILREKQEELQLAETVYDNTADAIVVTDPGGHVISVNPAFTEITGYQQAEIQGLKLSAISSGLYGKDFYQQLWSTLLAERKWHGEIINRRKNGELFSEQLTITAVTDRHGTVTQYVGTFSDITDKKAAASQIEFLAYHDALTKLPNWTLGRQMAEEAIARAQRHNHLVGVMFMDLDNFKLVNDTYGHSMGDKLLQAIASRLREKVRAEDILCRLSGDEFMLIFAQSVQPENIAAACEHILDEVGQPYQLDGRLIPAAFSAGIAVYPADGEDVEELLRKADTAMFEAKRSGRNTYRFFDASMNQRVVTFVDTRESLANALRNGELRLYYQPQIRQEDGVVTGVEALIRWQHPQRGLLSPGHFIDVAERSGLIVPIGAWVMRQASRQMSEWLEAGLNLQTVAINLSAIQFQNADIQETVTQALSEARLAPEHLELELTESILIGDREETLERVRRLKALGVRLSIDDFGTGYSSMAYLKRFKVHKIKIDASFAAGLDQDAEDAAIVRSIIQMAQALGMETTAEGVERAEAAAVLRALGCTHIQGYYYARPMPAAEFKNWMASYSSLVEQA